MVVRASGREEVEVVVVWNYVDCGCGGCGGGGSEGASGSGG